MTLSLESFEFAHAACPLSNRFLAWKNEEWKFQVQGRSECIQRAAVHRNGQGEESVSGDVSFHSNFRLPCFVNMIPVSRRFAVIFYWNVLKFYLNYCRWRDFFSEALKEADSAKTRTLQQLKEENKTLTQQVDNRHKGQSELSKVKTTRLASHISHDVVQFLCVLLVSYKTMDLNSLSLSLSLLAQRWALKTQKTAGGDQEEVSECAPAVDSSNFNRVFMFVG